MLKPIKDIIVLVILLAAPFVLAAQDDYAIVDRCEELINYNTIRNANKQIEQLTTLLSDAQESRDKKLETQTYKQLGHIYIAEFQDYPKAMVYFIKSLNLEEQQNFSEEIAITQIAIASLYNEVGELIKSVEYLNRALNESKKLSNIHLTVFIQAQLGKINIKRTRLDLATNNYEEILANKKSTNLKFGAEAHYNLAEILTLKLEYDSALKHYLEAIAIQREVSNTATLANYLVGFGKYCEQTNQLDRAMNNYKAALSIWQKLNLVENISFVYNQIGAFYYKQQNYDRAIANINLALKSANQANAQYQLQRSYKLLSLSYNKLKNTDKVLKSQIEHLGITELIEHDSIVNAEVIYEFRKELQELETKLKVSKMDSTIQELEEDKQEKEIEINEKKREIEVQQRNVLLLGISVALTMVIVLLTFYSYLNKRKSNKKLAEANQQIAQKNEELHDLNATKDKFFSILGHDLKGPLNSLSSFTYLLRDHIDSMSKEEIQALAKDLDKSQKNLYALLENLLEWSRSQTGNIEFTPEELDITAMLNENIVLLQAQAANKKLALINKSTESLIIKTHKNSITTVVRNLISNAIKFTPENGSIALNWEKSNCEVIISVTDTGVGMSPTILDKLFRIDTKHSTVGTAEEKGTGLGLVLCKEFVEKNDGKIWAKSEVDKGSTFAFSLPLS